MSKVGGSISAGNGDVLKGLKSPLSKSCRAFTRLPAGSNDFADFSALSTFQKN